MRWFSDSSLYLPDMECFQIMVLPWNSQTSQKITSLSIQPSSPKFPQSNGEAERAVCKTLLQKADDPYAALLAYRSTPVCCGYSPAELLMNRQLHSTVPIAPTQLQPVIPDYSKLKEREETMREKQTENFNSHHQSRELTPLFPGETVWVTDQQTPCLMLHAPEVEGFLLTCRGL